MRTRIFSSLRSSASLVGLVALAGIAGGAGCLFAPEEEVSTSPDEVVGGAQVSVLLKSTLVLDAGCIATKVGPRHLLLSARCVTGNEAFARGKVLGFRTANTATADARKDAVLDPTSGSGGDADEPRDAGAPAKDGGSSAAKGDAGKADAGTTPASASGREVTIAEVSVHPSYEAKCAGDACGLGKLEASDAPDVALVILEDDLETVPSVPVDLDAVGQADRVFVLASGCEIVGAEEGTGITTTRTIAVPPKSANHPGSPYEEAPQRIGTLAASYVVTAGPGWRKTEAQICTSDLGAPVFRSGVAAVAGITSNFTAWQDDTFVPVTVHHTRLDAQSRFKIGVWLETQGVETLHSCSERAGGCTKREYDGGGPVPPSAGPGGGGTTTPDEDGGAGVIPPADGGDADGDDGDDGDADDIPTNPGPAPGREEDLADLGPPDDGYYQDGDYDDYADAAAPRKKKKKKQEGGCSAAPGPMPAGEVGLVLGVGLAVMAIGRRRRR